MVILRSQNKITDFLMILAWASPFKLIEYRAVFPINHDKNNICIFSQHQLTYGITAIHCIDSYIENHCTCEKIQKIHVYISSFHCLTVVIDHSIGIFRDALVRVFYAPETVFIGLDHSIWIFRDALAHVFYAPETVVIGLDHSIWICRDALSRVFYAPEAVVIGLDHSIGICRDALARVFYAPETIVIDHSTEICRDAVAHVF